MASEWKKLREALSDAGFIVELGRGSRHWKIYRHHADDNRDELVSTLPNTASDHRSFQNALSELRTRVGFDYRPKQTRKKGSE